MCKCNTCLIILKINLPQILPLSHIRKFLFCYSNLYSFHTYIRQLQKFDDFLVTVFVIENIIIHCFLQLYYKFFFLLVSRIPDVAHTQGVSCARNLVPMEDTVDWNRFACQVFGLELFTV